MLGFQNFMKKEIDNKTTTHAMRIFSASRSRLIMCRFQTTKAWTVPSVIAEPGRDPYEKMLSYLFDKFYGFENVVSIVFLDQDVRTIKTTKGYDELTTNLYDVELDSNVVPAVFEPFDIVRWTPVDMIKSEQMINNATAAVRKMMEKEK